MIRYKCKTEVRTWSSENPFLLLNPGTTNIIIYDYQAIMKKTQSQDHIPTTGMHAVMRTYIHDEIYTCSEKYRPILRIYTRVKTLKYQESMQLW